MLSEIGASLMNFKRTHNRASMKEKYEDEEGSGMLCLRTIGASLMNFKRTHNRASMCHGSIKMSVVKLN